MKSESKMRSRLLAVIITALCSSAVAEADTVPAMFSRPVEWHIGVEVTPSWVPGTNDYLKGENPMGRRVSAAFGGALRADFSFNPETREGILYRGLYQGVGVTANGYFPCGLLGMPVSAYVYQGAPIVKLGQRLSLGYEWQFGAAFGWQHYEKDTAEDNLAVGTPVTAHMGIAIKLNYQLAERWRMTFGIVANHYSNGNTSWPNYGVNTIGASIGIAYVVNPQGEPRESVKSDADADRRRWVYDLMAYGAWRRRAVTIGYPEEAVLCPGRFGILGLQFSPLCKLNRWVAVGPALDLQWDESGGIESYWIVGSYDENIKFQRPPFGKQISVGLSAHAELTMPIFSVNVGLGYDVVNPKGEKAFYQSLTLKTFVTKNLFINTGYRLGSFKDPQNLMLGLGLRL